MKFTNNKEDGAVSGHLLPPNEAFSTGNTIHLIEPLFNGDPWKPPNKPRYCQGYWLLSQTEKALLMKKTPTQLIEQGKVELVPT